jgi:hypothetical protein
MQALTGWDLNGDLDMLLDDPSLFSVPQGTAVATSPTPWELVNLPNDLHLQPENMCVPLTNVSANCSSSLFPSSQHPFDVCNPSRLDLPVDVERQSLIPMVHEIPRAPSTTIRVLVGRPKLTPASKRVEQLILHTLKSYPRMLRNDDIPPFIHSSMVSLDDDPDIDLEPLTNCIGLIHMIGGGSRKSPRKLFWQNVRNECERIRANVRVEKRSPRSQTMKMKTLTNSLSQVREECQQMGNPRRHASLFPLHPHPARRGRERAQ